MSSLRTAIVLVLAASAAPAFAEQISCESRGSGPEPCGTIVAGSSVRLVRQLGSAACVEGRTWGTGAAHDSLWVSGGCHAVFDVQPRGGAADSDLAGGGYGHGDSTARNDGAAGADDDDANDRAYADSDRESDSADRDADDRGDSADEQSDRDGRYARDDDRYAESRDSRFGARSDSGRDTDADDEEQDEDEAADEAGRDQSDRQVASATGGYARARQACIDEAAAGRSFGPDDVDAGAVRAIEGNLLSIEIGTPDGDLTCTVDRDGNVRSLR